MLGESVICTKNKNHPLVRKFMAERSNALPKGMIHFSQLPISMANKKSLSYISISTFFLALFIFGVLHSLQLTLLGIISFFGCFIFSYILLMKDHLKMLSLPLAVDMNHPFMDQDPIGDSTVMVRLSNKTWIEVGECRVRLMKDDLVGGYLLVMENEDYTPIGHFTHSKNYKHGLKVVAIINQALSLRDATNGVQDNFEAARERESLDYGLLEREWLSHEEMEIESPLAKLVSKE